MRCTGPWAAAGGRATVGLKTAPSPASDFPHPIGLAAGYDKSGELIATLAALGFGSVEIGSVSIDPSDGNPKPRLWRLPEERAVLVHYGMRMTARAS